MKAEIVIATYNGAKRLGKTLDSFGRLTTPKDQWRILIVDNNSSDDTSAIATGFQDRLPLQIIRVPTAGKSVALNAAIPSLTSDVIFFSDDDVEVMPDWLDKMLTAVERETGYDVFAGRIIGKWEKELPPSLARFVPIGSTYAIHDRDVSGPCDPGLVWGPNMAIRRHVFEAGHRYNEAVGPQPKKLYPMGQDSEMAKRLDKAGHKSYFVADAVVRHTVKAETISEDWILRRAERLGYGIFAVDGGAGYRRKFPSLPLKLELTINRIRSWVLCPFTFIMPPKHKFWERWSYYYHRGLYKSYQSFVAAKEEMTNP